MPKKVADVLNSGGKVMSIKIVDDLISADSVSPYLTLNSDM